MSKAEEALQQPKPEQHKEEDSGDDEDQDVEKEVIGNWKIVDLKQMPVITGEQQQEEVAKFKTKIYRFRNEWKERGVGELRFLKHKASHLVRILTRAQKTHKCIMNHYIRKENQQFGAITTLKTSNNALTWVAYDISDEEPKIQKLAARFVSKDQMERFLKIYEESNESNMKIFKASKQEGQKAEGEKVLQTTVQAAKQ